MRVGGVHLIYMYSSTGFIKSIIRRLSDLSRSPPAQQVAKFKLVL